MNLRNIFNHQRIEYILSYEGIICVHDFIVNNFGLINSVSKFKSKAAKIVDNRLTIHDFRIFKPWCDIRCRLTLQGYKVKILMKKILKIL